MAAELERGDEAEPPAEEAELADLETELEDLSFPATGAEVVAAVGEREIESGGSAFSLAELIPESEEERFDSPAAVRVQIQRPTIAAAMKRIVVASETLRNTEFNWAQRKAYEKTLRELERIDADDDDEGITVISRWVVDRIHEKEKLPTSRAVRREAAKFCRSNGYQIRDDQWLGI